MGLELLDPVRRHEQVTATDPDLQARDQRELIAGIEPGDHILHAPQPLTGGVKQRTADQRGQMQRRFGHHQAGSYVSVERA